ncbi:hypothetical protein [Herbaspirillum sp. ST 5-3]|uniref:hypothetical protein n=1 Tax=Oxalobacteraceae TaxID=75682 RepID=UPI001B3BCC39|nr:hypothetical protein [Herbaspirillum sp. ST 5-3]
MVRQLPAHAGQGARPERHHAAGHERMRPSQLVEQVGGTYAEELGIDLHRHDSGEVFKWFIAAVLFGARISESLAMRTHREFQQAGVLSPSRMLDAGWDKLVELLDRGGYTRYDFKTATKLLDLSQTLQEQYQGDLNALHEDARDEADLEQRLMALGKGIGPVTVNIFLREMRGIWPQAKPLPSERAIRAARALGFIHAAAKDPARILQGLESAWRSDGMKSKDFAAFEAALVRHESQLWKRRQRGH